jgi:hypothetical protein
MKLTAAACLICTLGASINAAVLFAGDGTALNAGLAVACLILALVDGMLLAVGR